jgi:pimeloyl-ACP methyl ester carboxylesterase
MQMRRSVFALFILFPPVLMADESLSQDPPAEPPQAAEVRGGIRTLGGRQFWGDVVYFRGWRIQHNVLLGQHRLLDPQDKRHISGTREQCDAKLKEFREKYQLKEMDGRAVVLIHGIGRSSRSFQAMKKKLAEDGYTVVGFDYPSTRVSIPESCRYLHSVLQSLHGIDSIDVVCHSMGGLLLRSYLMEYREPRFRRAVMLGVPNQGARLADMLKTNRLFKAVLGPAGQQLVSEGLVEKLPTPSFPFAVIAGGRSGEKGYNPILPEDNDSTVTVSSTRLPGATDFLLVPVIHSFLMSNEKCVTATQHFLKHGTLIKDRPAVPIPVDDASEDPS